MAGRYEEMAGPGGGGEPVPSGGAVENLLRVLSAMMGGGEQGAPPPRQIPGLGAKDYPYPYREGRYREWLGEDRYPGYSFDRDDTYRAIFEQPPMGDTALSAPGPTGGYYANSPNGVDNLALLLATMATGGYGPRRRPVRPYY